MAAHLATALHSMLTNQPDEGLCKYVKSSENAPFWDSILGFNLMHTGHDYGDIMTAAEQGNVKELRKKLMSLFCEVMPLLSRFGSLEDFQNFKTDFIKWGKPGKNKRYDKFMNLEWKWDKTNPLTRGAPFTQAGKEYNEKIARGEA
jgi:hypothetical protein